MSQIIRIPRWFIPPAGPSSDCLNCSTDCDGAATIGLTLSWVPLLGGPCTPFLNGTTTLSRYATCSWGDGGPHAVSCRLGVWNLYIAFVGDPGCGWFPIALNCGGDHPWGSGTHICTCQSQTTTVSWTIT